MRTAAETTLHKRGSDSVSPRCLESNRYSVSRSRSHAESGHPGQPDTRQRRQEERRRADNQPYSETVEVSGDDYKPAYKHSVIGSMDDLNAASLGWHGLLPSPTRRTTPRLRWSATSMDARWPRSKVFESIPSRLRRRQTRPNPGKKRSVGFRLRIRSPGCRKSMGYKDHRQPADAYAMQVLNQALATGQSSRFYQVVKEGAVAESSRSPMQCAGMATTRSPQQWRQTKSLRTLRRQSTKRFHGYNASQSPIGSLRKKNSARRTDPGAAGLA